MARTSSAWALLVGIFAASLHAADGAVMQGSDDTSDEDPWLQKLAENDFDLGDAKDDFSIQRPRRHSLRHARHPLALAHAAPADLDKDLEEKAKVVSEDLRSTVDEAVHHSKDGITLKHDIAQKGVKLRIDEKKLRKLASEEGRLEETKDNLFSSLHEMLDAKLEVANRRVEKKEAVLHRNEEVAEEWKHKAEELKTVSKDVIKEKHAIKQALLEAEAEVARAKEKEDNLRRKLARANQEAGEKVQSFQYAEARYQAQLAHQKAAEKAAAEAKESLDELTHTFGTESQKVEQSLAYHKQQLSRKINSVEEDREKANHELAELNEKFAEWKKDQHREKEEIANKRREQELVSEEAAEKKRQIKQAVKEKVVVANSLESKGDWDSWGSADTDSES